MVNITTRPWAFWRRIQYGTGYLFTLMLLMTSVYYLAFYEAPACFDNKMNGNEVGTDCGGACTRICAFTVTAPRVVWAKSFPANSGQYNAVAYVENANAIAGTPDLRYTFTLRDASGVIATRSGTTILPGGNTYPVFEGRIDTGGRTPTETILTLEPADMWVPTELGREQFKTSDLLLSGADERPRLSAKVENTELEEAMAVEVVATIFDSLGTPLTSSQTFIDEFSARSAELVTFTWPQPIAKTLRSCEVPTDVVVAIDLSGSMNNDGANPPEPITSVLKAASNFVGQLRAADQVSVVTFATKATTSLPLTRDTAAAAQLISKLAIAPAEEVGSTNTGDALLSAQAELNSARHNNDARSVLVLLTDGLATAPGETPEDYAAEQAVKVKEDDITVFTIGLGAGVNMDFLRGVASTPEQAFLAPSTATLGSIYQRITAAICEEGASRIEVIPKTSSNFAPLQ